jgi:Tfp pilus assembly protein PilX
MKAKAFTHKQQGAVTLFTALVLLISITLVGFVTAKTVLVETQITADNYRTSQAAAAASAAMDQAVAYFNAGGLDQHNNATPTTLTADGLVDYPSTAPFALTLTAAGQTTTAQFFFNNTATGNRCDSAANGNNMTQGLVTATGWSDDNTAVRTITQCVATLDIFDSGKGPRQAFISRAGVGVFGNAKIINRYSNSSIWSGGADAVHGASYGTYLRPSNTDIADYTTAQLNSADETTNTQLVSNRNAGNGIDVITNDPTLSSKTTSTTDLTNPAQNQFFDMFFAQTKSAIRQIANNNDQLLAAGADPSGDTGLIWVDGNTSMHNGAVVGSPTSPAILIVNGDLDLTGGTIYGVLYVTGNLRITGNPVVHGSVVSENGPNSGAGTLTLVYQPWGGDGTGSPPFVTGTGAIIAGSWKDW